MGTVNPNDPPAKQARDLAPAEPEDEPQAQEDQDEREDKPRDRKPK